MCLRSWLFSSLPIGKRTVVFQLNHGFVCPKDIFEPVVQVLTCPLYYSLFFVLSQDHLAVSAPVKSPAENPPRSNNRTLGHLVACSVHHFHELSGRTLIIDLHSLLNQGQDFGRQLELPTASWETTKGTMVLVFLDHSPDSLPRNSVPFCGQDFANVPVQYSSIVV